MSGPNDDVLIRVYDLAFAYERDYGCCSQCVLAALQDELGVGDDGLLRASHTLAGGGAVTVTGTCGALAGALLAVGSVHGRERADFGAGPHAESFRQGKRVIDAFVEEFGSPLCADVQARLMGRSFNLLDPEDFRAFEAAGGHTDKCTHVVGVAAQIAARILQTD
jgi:C_GCAxxG_C_C family probable redox protein